MLTTNKLSCLINTALALLFAISLPTYGKIKQKPPAFYSDSSVNRSPDFEWHHIDSPWDALKKIEESPDYSHLTVEDLHNIYFYYKHPESSETSHFPDQRTSLQQIGAIKQSVKLYSVKGHSPFIILIKGMVYDIEKRKEHNEQFQILYNALIQPVITSDIEFYQGQTFADAFQNIGLEICNSWDNGKQKLYNVLGYCKQTMHHTSIKVARLFGINMDEHYSKSEGIHCESLTQLQADILTFLLQKNGNKRFQYVSYSFDTDVGTDADTGSSTGAGSSTISYKSIFLSTMILFANMFTGAEAASTPNSVLFEGISPSPQTFNHICSGKGAFYIWRINGNEVAIFNGRESIGHSIVNTYNATTLEFNATLLSAVSFNGQSFRISNIQTNKRLYTGSVLTCETDLGSASVTMGATPMEATPKPSATPPAESASTGAITDITTEPQVTTELGHGEIPFCVTAEEQIKMADESQNCTGSRFFPMYFGSGVGVGMSIGVCATLTVVGGAIIPVLYYKTKKGGNDLT